MLKIIGKFLSYSQKAFVFTAVLLVFFSIFSKESFALGPIKITTTTQQVADLVRNIAGERAEVRSILGSGTDPHLYKLTRSDTATLLRSDVVFYNGLMLEGRMVTVFERLEQAHKPIYAISDLISEPHFIAEGDVKADPHIWNDVELWARASGGVAEALCDYDREGCSLYQANAKKYQRQLLNLHHYVNSLFQGVPEESRILITAHDAFNYLGRAYHLDVIGIQGISTDSEAGLKHMNELVDLIIKNNVKSIFVETSVSDKNIKALIEGAKAKNYDLKLGGMLYSDAMGDKGSDAETYIQMIDYNARTIAKALGGRMPLCDTFENCTFFAKHP